MYVCLHKSIITGEMANFVLSNSTWNTFESYLIHTEKFFFFFNVQVSFPHKEWTRVWCSYTIAVFMSPSTMFHA